MSSTLPRRFELYRHKDISGISGTGVIAYGCEYPGGIVTLCWVSPHPSVVIWTSIEDMMKIHGHDGATELLWIDGEADEPMSVPEPSPARLALAEGAGRV